MQDLEEARKIAFDQGRDALRRTVRWPVLVGLEIRGGEIRRRQPLPPLPRASGSAPKVASPGSMLPQAVAANSVYAGTMMHLEEVDPRVALHVEPEMMASRPMSARRYVELRRDPRRTTPWLVIGRSHEADILINDFTISGRHAAFMVHPETGAYVLQDGGSTNGTTVGDEPLQRGVSCVLHSGDRVTFGRLVFLLLSPEDFYEYLVTEEAA
ncbi:MAG: FHA domain-containing protein [Myxococcota bacterium]